jgi:hypothetical protein
LRRVSATYFDYRQFNSPELYNFLLDDKTLRNEIEQGNEAAEVLLELAKNCGYNVFVFANESLRDQVGFYVLPTETVIKNAVLDNTVGADDESRALCQFIIEACCKKIEADKNFKPDLELDIVHDRSYLKNLGFFEEGLESFIKDNTISIPKTYKDFKKMFDKDKLLSYEEMQILENEHLQEFVEQAQDQGRARSHSI